MRNGASEARSCFGLAPFFRLSYPHRKRLREAIGRIANACKELS